MTITKKRVWEITKAVVIMAGYLAMMIALMALEPSDPFDVVLH